MIACSVISLFEQCLPTEFFETILVKLISQLTKPTSTHRWLAIVAVFVFVAGKTLHVHQECSSCCEFESPVVSEEVEVCPYGCQHHATTSHSDCGSEENDSRHSNQPHDEHQCAVCSVLAAASQCPIILGLPELHSLVQPATELNVSVPDCLEVRIVRLRGPPVV